MCPHTIAIHEKYLYKVKEAEQDDTSCNICPQQLESSPGSKFDELRDRPCVTFWKCKKGHNFKCSTAFHNVYSAPPASQKYSLDTYSILTVFPEMCLHTLKSRTKASFDLQTFKCLNLHWIIPNWAVLWPQVKVKKHQNNNKKSHITATKETVGCTERPDHGTIQCRASITLPSLDTASSKYTAIWIAA